MQTNYSVNLDFISSLSLLTLPFSIEPASRKYEKRAFKRHEELPNQEQATGAQRTRVPPGRIVLEPPAAKRSPVPAPPPSRPFDSLFFDPPQPEPPLDTHIKQDKMEEAQQLHLRLLKFNRGDSTDEGEALDVLRTLEKSTITYAILKDTKLGHTVGKMRKHENEKLANQAKLLVKSWKSMALSPKPTQGATPTLERKLSGMSSDGDRIPKKSVVTPPTNGSSSSSSKTNGVKAEAKPVVPAPPKPTAPAPSRFASKGPFIPAGFDKVRATVRTKLKEILQASEGGDAEDTAIAIEVSMARMFNMGYPGENKKDYTTKFRQLSFNLKKNSPLREDLLQDAVSAEQLINMTAEELATEEKRHEIQKLRDDAFNKARLDWADANEDKINKQCGIENAKGLFTCGRCKSSKTSNTQKQTRSADEPMTVFVQCHNCGNRWKC